jgi:hypothetical protein
MPASPRRIEISEADLLEFSKMFPGIEKSVIQVLTILIQFFNCHVFNFLTVMLFEAPCFTRKHANVFSFLIFIF